MHKLPASPKILAVIVSKNRHTCSKLHHLYSVFSKCPPPVRTKITDVDELKQLIKNEWADLNHVVIQRVVGDMALATTCLCSHWRQIFRACDVKLMWLFYYTFDDFCNNNCYVHSGLWYEPNVYKQIFYACSMFVRFGLITLDMCQWFHTWIL